MDNWTFSKETDDILPVYFGKFCQGILLQGILPGYFDKFCRGICQGILQGILPGYFVKVYILPELFARSGIFRISKKGANFCWPLVLHTNSGAKPYFQIFSYGEFCCCCQVSK